MKKLSTLYVIFTILITSTVYADTVFYCQSELATGFIKKNGVWKTTNFNLTRYTIKFNDDYSVLTGLDEGLPFICRPPYGSVPNMLACLSSYGNAQSFLFDKQTNRFVLSFAKVSGYLTNESDSDTENLYAGICQTF